MCLMVGGGLKLGVSDGDGWGLVEQNFVSDTKGGGGGGGME